MLVRHHAVRRDYKCSAEGCRSQLSSRLYWCVWPELHLPVFCLLFSLTNGRSFSLPHTGYKSLPVLDDQLTTTDGGTPGWTGSFYCHNDDSSGEHRAEPIKVVDLVQTHLFFFDALPEGITRRWSFELKGRSLLRAKDTQFQFGLTVMGRAKLFVDGEVVIDNWTRQARAPGELNLTQVARWVPHTALLTSFSSLCTYRNLVAFYGMGTPEVKGEVLLRAGQTHEILLQFQNVYGPAPGDEAESFVGSQRGGITLGGAEVLHEDQSIAEAAQLARDSDVAVVIVGLNADWETEGVDRDSLELPGRTNDLVREVVKANKKTVVVCQSVGLLHPLTRLLLVLKYFGSHQGVCCDNALG